VKRLLGQGVIGMKRFYVLLVVLVVAVASALGVYAVTRSAKLGLPSATPQSANTIVAQGSRRLNATEAALNRALAQRPPSVRGGRLPFVPPQQIVVNVSGSSAAVPYTAPTGHFFDDGGGGGD
jgi:hypothetical protein